MLLNASRVAVVVMSSLLLASCGEDSFFNRRILGKKGDSPRGSSACDAAGVQRITVDRQYDNSSAGTFAYAFEYVPAADNNPTIVYIPGGPGQTAIGDSKSWLEDIPAGYGLVLTDPRGVGCNYQDPDRVGLDFYKSEYVARDVLSAVKNLGVKNYSLYGISYGTLVATMAGSIAEKDTAGQWPKPQSVVLEGVLARAFASSSEADSKYIDLWHEKLAMLTVTAGAEKAALFKQTPLPLNKSAEDWGAAIRLGLMIGTINYESGDVIDVVEYLIGGAVSDDAKRRSATERLFDNLTKDDGSFTKGSDAFYAVIACQEVFPNMQGIYFENGDFTRGRENYCSQMGLSGSRLFDVKSWPISAPIYYLEGRDDPATPAAIAKTHFEAQTTSPQRQYLLVNRAGHNPYGLNMADCADTVWAAMTSNKDFKAAVSGCAWAKQDGFLLSSGDGTEEAIGNATSVSLRGFSLKAGQEATASAPDLDSVRLRSYLPVK